MNGNETGTTKQAARTFDGSEHDRLCRHRSGKAEVAQLDLLVVSKEESGSTAQTGVSAKALGMQFCSEERRTVPPGPIRMFCGFISRWMMRFECK